MVSATRVTFNPADVTTICTSGPKFLKLWRNADGQLKGFNFGLGKREHQNYTDHCWLPRDKLVACADSGDVYIFDQGELKQHIELRQQNASSSHSQLLCVCAFARGFIAAGAGGRLCVFEVRDEKEGFQLIYTFSCTQAVAASVGAMANSGGDRMNIPLDITSICPTPSEEMLMCACGAGQLASFPLANIDILQPTQAHFHFFGGGGFHQKAITGLDCCVRKPLVVTCSIDRSMRIWNYSTKICEQVKHFAEEPISASLHPSGLHVLLGFSDKLRLFNILMDDVRQLADFAVKSCRECRFSHGGQCFAAVSGPYISIFNTYTFEQVASLKGHSGPVKSISWKADDLGMVSAGYDGAVYEWQWGVDGMSRVGSCDHVLKSSQYEAVTCAFHKANVFVAAGRDGMLREIEGGNVSQELRTDSGRITQLQLSSTERLLIVGTETGVVRLHDAPPLPFGVREVITAHSSTITRMCLAHDESYLFTASDSGELLMFELVSSAHERARRKDEEVGTELDTVLVSRTELLERFSGSEELEQKVKEQQMQAEYQAHLTEQYYLDQIKKEKEDAHGVLEVANERFETLARQKEALEREHAEKVQAMEVAHMRVAEELENLYERKLTTEVARWEALRKEKDDMQCRLEEQIYALHKQVREANEKLRIGLHEKDAVAKQELAAMAKKEKHMEASYHERLRQEEEDNDRELEASREAAQRALVLEREEKQVLKGEQAIMRKKFEGFQSEMSKLRSALEMREQDIRRLQKEAAESEKATALLRRDIHEREESISDKERRMAELKSKNKELEKFKFVLDYKLRELAKEIEPRDEQIMQMRETIRELDDELQRDYRSNVSLEQLLAEKQGKIDSLQTEVKKARQAVLEKERFIKFFARDLHRIVGFTDAHQLREGVKAVYRTYVKRDSMELETSADDLQVQAEFTQQRQYMERALQALKTSVGRTEEQTRVDFTKKVAENEKLINECNRLRKETKELRAQLAALRQEQLQTPARRPTTSAGVLRPGTPGKSVESLPPAEPHMSPALAGANKAGRGQLFKGSASVSGRDRNKLAELTLLTENQQRELEIQRAEIRRLREQVRVLLSHSGATGTAPEQDAESINRPQSSQEARAPLPDARSGNPRAQSALR